MLRKMISVAALPDLRLTRQTISWYLAGRTCESWAWQTKTIQRTGNIAEVTEELFKQVRIFNIQYH
jgi:hypothetical protein